MTMDIRLARVDSRLLHGQVATFGPGQSSPTESWLFLIQLPKIHCARP